MLTDIENHTSPAYLNGIIKAEDTVGELSVAVNVVPDDEATDTENSFNRQSDLENKEDIGKLNDDSDGT